MESGERAPDLSSDRPTAGLSRLPECGSGEGHSTGTNKLYPWDINFKIKWGWRNSAIGTRSVFGVNFHCRPLLPFRWSRQVVQSIIDVMVTRIPLSAEEI